MDILHNIVMAHNYVMHAHVEVKRYFGSGGDRGGVKLAAGGALGGGGG